MLADSGLFITVEGLEGVGKSTNMAFIQHWLEQNQYSVKVTREPGGTDLAEEIRSLLLAKRQESVAANTELLMMFAARAQHIAQKIQPWLEQGYAVLSDRFTDATYAYQGGGRQLNWQSIELLETLVQQRLQPKLTILLDAPAEIGLERIKIRGHTDRIEQEALAFFQRARTAYLARAEQYPERIVVVDASLTLIAVQQKIQQCLEQRLL